MISRIFVTLVMFFLAIYAFWSGAFGEGHVFNPFGILFLGLTAIIWFAWETVRDAFRTAKNESDIPIIRMGFPIIKGMMRPPRDHHRSDEHS
ncbi:MAG: hypothetical protein ACREFK_14750 [Stellaceae bacterium]